MSCQHGSQGDRHNKQRSVVTFVCRVAFVCCALTDDDVSPVVHCVVALGVLFGARVVRRPLALLFFLQDPIFLRRYLVAISPYLVAHSPTEHFDADVVALGRTVDNFLILSLATVPQTNVTLEAEHHLSNAADQKGDGEY